MFQGHNELVLNQATMIEAVQLYLDSKFKEGQAPKVNSVMSTSEGSFRVKTSDKQETKE